MLLVGCSSGTMKTGLYDSDTGKTRVIVYSKSYDNAAWLLKDRLGIAINVEHDKQGIPPSPNTKLTAETRSTRDAFSTGRVTLALWNFDSAPHQVTFKRMLLSSGEMDFGNHTVTAAPHAEVEIGAGVVPIFSYDKAIRMTLDLEVAGKPHHIELELPRRTQQQFAQFSAPGAVRPYPWGARRVTQ